MGPDGPDRNEDLPFQSGGLPSMLPENGRPGRSARPERVHQRDGPLKPFIAINYEPIPPRDCMRIIRS